MMATTLAFPRSQLEGYRLLLNKKHESGYECVTRHSKNRERWNAGVYGKYLRKGDTEGVLVLDDQGEAMLRCGCMIPTAMPPSHTACQCCTAGRAGGANGRGATRMLSLPPQTRAAPTRGSASTWTTSGLGPLR